MSTFIISDLHFGHENLAIKRGFKSAEEQDDYIIENWNKVVNKRDLVIIPGDISMEKKVHVQKLQLLKGFKHVIPGNHDMKNISELLKYCQKVTGPIKYKKNMWITHFLYILESYMASLTYMVMCTRRLYLTQIF